MSWLDLIALTPILVLILGATTLLLLSAWYREPRALICGGIVTALVAALFAGVAPPPGHEIAGLFHCTPYARFFTAFWSLIAAITLMVSSRGLIGRKMAAGEYVSLVLYAATGMSLMSSASSLIGLFLGLEAFSLSLYVLIAFDRRSDEAAEAGIKYLVMGAVATGFLAFGIGLVYATSGSFHLPEAFQGLQTAGELHPWGLLGWCLILVAIGFKISLAPFHLWTPDVYQGAPAPVGGLLATGSKGAVVAALVSVLSGGETGWGDLHSLLWLIAAVTMLAGALAALPQQNIKRLLAYSSVVHMGTLLVGLVTVSPDGLSATIFYLVTYAIASIGTFAVITSLSDGRVERQHLDDWRGLGLQHPYRCTVFAVLLLSLAGMPPTAGFMAKFAIFHAALQAGETGLVLVGILASLISFAFYLRVIMVMFMEKEAALPAQQGDSVEHGVLAACLSAVLLLGLYPGLLFDLVSLLMP